MPRTRVEVDEDLTSVRTAIRAAEEAQAYGSALGNQKTMANLTTLYEREEKLLAERSALDAGSGYCGMVRNVGRVAR